MFKTLLQTLLFTFAATTAHAADPLSASEFDDYTVGKTLTFSEGGLAYGTEQYFSNNRVKWAFDEDTCVDGFWYEEESNICFVYEHGGDPQCWQFFLQGDKLRAVFQGSSGTELYEAEASDSPLTCMGPQVGV
ncbi:hypothetical protein [Celeribacter arenosi]|uniref:Beta/Gamma crystallin n=1 Tax=Celeribacter arenosi TaxID=792649 RepID=A0ABP7KA78_9RHOB